MTVAWAEARRIAGSAAPAMPPVELGIAEATGRVLMRPVEALQDIPHYVSSAMDGWAVAGDEPWQLVTSGSLRPGQAQVVVTGGVLPVGTLGVLRREFGRDADGMLVRTPDTKPGEPSAGSNVRAAATEAVRGDLLIAAGTVLNPAHIAVAAGCGHDTLVVAARPSVTLLLTGDEVITAGRPEAGQVRDSFGPQLPAVLRMLGADVVATERVRDAHDDTVRALASTSTAHELVVMTGGTGRSDADHVRGALAELGATILVGSVAMRPGSPSMLARLPDGRLVVGLPGNPLAAMTGLLTLAAPVIAALAGTAPVEPYPVSVEGDAVGHPQVTVVAPCVVTDGVARVCAWRDSGMMRGLAEADALLVVSPGGAGESGSALALPLPWN